MANTTEIKKQIKEVVNKLSSEYGVNLHERDIVPNGRKYNGVAYDNSICLFVCNNKLQEGIIKAGQRSAIFEKCYWLSLSDCDKKLLVFTNKEFYYKFIEEYSDYLKGIELRLYINE